MIRQLLIYNSLNNTDPFVAIPVDDCLSVLMEEQIINRTKGYHTLTIVFPLDNPLVKNFRNERTISIGDDVFTIKKVTKQKSTSKQITIECESLWYQLNGGTPILADTSASASGATIRDGWATGTTYALLGIFASDVGWRTGTVEVVKDHNFKITPNSTRLYMIRYLAKLVECEIHFDTINRTVDFVKRVGTDTFKTVSYEHNLVGITRIDDSNSLCTRVYMFGADGITVSSINGGLPYIEDYSYYDDQGIPRQLISNVLTDDRFSILTSMLDYMREYLDMHHKPIVSYELEQFFIDEVLDIGDSIVILDKDLGLQERHRVVERTIDFIYPDRSIYVLDNAIDDLSSVPENDDNITIAASVARISTAQDQSE